MNSIRDLVAHNCSVIRGGIEKSIMASDVLVGDLVQLRIGQKVPADIRLIEVSPDLKFDRSLLTGERYYFFF